MEFVGCDIRKSPTSITYYPEEKDTKELSLVHYKSFVSVMSLQKIMPTQKNQCRVTKVYNHGLSILLVGVLLVSNTVSFTPGKTVRYSSWHQPLVKGTMDEYGEMSGDVVVDLQNFNPLKQHQSLSKSKSSHSYQGTQISLRQIKMQEMTSKLLEYTDDPQQMDKILNEYRVFLLEPLEDENCVLEPGSIYTPGMSRQERYKEYRRSMAERVESCKNGRVRQVLVSMRDYILSFEDDR